MDPKQTTTTTQPTKTPEQVEAERAKQARELIAKHGSVSGAIRALAAQGMERGQIAKLLNKRYQHVRNVLITPVKNPKPAPTPTTDVKQAAETATTTKK